MHLSALPLLACPNCGGLLGRSALPGIPDRFSPDGEDLVEGALGCAGCGRAFPVLSGVAVLIPDPDAYCRRHRQALLRDLERHGSLSPEARVWLTNAADPEAEQAEYGADFRYSQQFETPAQVARALAADPAALYGGFAEWLTSVEGPYELLARWTREHLSQRAVAVDAGCGAGGLVARIAPLFRAALGVDRSFLAVLLARRAVLHRPEAERSYFLSVTRARQVARPLDIPRAPNAEFVVGDCRALPLASGLCDAVYSANVLDVVEGDGGMDGPIREAARVLAPAGTLLLSDPFFFREGEAPEGDPVMLTRDALERHGLRLEAEQDGVPWLWGIYDRHWRVYFSYCAAVRKAVQLP